MATRRLAAKSSDLGALALRETATVVLYSPASPITKVDTGYRVEIKSLYSDEARNAVLLHRAKAEIAHADGGAEVPDTTFSDSLPEQVIAVTVRWWKEGESLDTITLNGEVLSATPENVRRVYEDPQFRWIPTAVQSHYLEIGNFFGASSGS